MPLAALNSQFNDLPSKWAFLLVYEQTQQITFYLVEALLFGSIEWFLLKVIL